MEAQTQVLTYDFSAVCPSGQTLWYKITDEANHYVELVAPGYFYDMGGWNGKPVYWKNYQRPVGNLVIPEQVQGYMVVGLLCRGSGDVYYDDGHYEELFDEVGALYSCSGLTSVVIPNTMTSIGTYAFSDCSNLTSIDIPNSVTSIGYGAFRNCSSLASIVIPNTVTSLSGTFYGCTSLTSVIIPNSVTSLSRTFEGCTGLTSIDIPNSVTIIEGTFANCTSLTSINIPNSVTYIENGAFSNCISLTSVVIPNSVTQLGRTIHYQSYPGGPYNTAYVGGGFNGCVNLVSITIPNSVTYIGTGTFSGCSSLTSITIPVSVDTIRDSAFENCISLNEVNFEATNCTYMGSSSSPVFSGCSSLNTINIGENVQIIPYYAFKDCNSITLLNYNATDCTAYVDYNSSVFNCTALTELNIGENVQTIPASAFRGCSGVTSLNIPNSVTSIGSSAFLGFNGTFITIPKSVSSIGNDAFKGCSRLTTVYYNAENATGSSAFSNCTNLTTIHIGADVQEIRPVFSGCSSVHLVVALGPTPAVLESNALTDIAGNSILVVSCGKRLTYFSVWNMFDFNNILEDCDEYSINLNNIGTGGNVSASTTQAQMGQEIQLTVTPNAGMMLSSISVCNATDPAQTIPVYPIGKAGSKYGFIMPPFGVSVNATFTAGTSVNENNDVPISVYPNPTYSQIKIEAENLKHITISNLLGQTVFDGNASGNEFEYDFSKHKAGIYLIRIETASGVVVKKVSVTR